MTIKDMTAFDAAVAGTVEAVLSDRTVRSATTYLDPKFVIKVTRRRVRRKLPPINYARGVDLVVTLGRPNARDRAIIKRTVRQGRSVISLGTRTT